MAGEGHHDRGAMARLNHERAKRPQQRQPEAQARGDRLVLDPDPVICFDENQGRPPRAAAS
jgi:hypothetical protein